MAGRLGGEAMSPEQRKAFDKQVAKASRETVEMVDGRIYYSDDNWETVWKKRLGGLGGGRPAIGKEADLARFLAVSQSSASPNWKGPRK